ncbi:hypothetical protein WN943_018251 [Citrus x changshan-huyou]
MILVLLRFWFILEFWCTFWEALLLTHAYRVSQNFHFCACLGENVDLFDFFFLFGFLFVSCRWNSWNFFACNISETIIKETGICLLTHMIPLFYYTMLGSSYELC